jgi:Concanavalin A-like lectin/glucanases superfamily
MPIPFGFDGANGVDLRPTHVAAVKPWARDESVPGAGDGTRLGASQVNALVGNLRHLLDWYGVSGAESDDTLVRQAIQAAIDAILMSDIPGLTAALAALAPRASPALTGAPSAPTAAPGSNTTQLATTAFVMTQQALLLSSLDGAGNDQHTKILLHFDGADGSTTITDSNAGGSAHTWTAAGNAQIDTAQAKFGGSSGLFDGVGDYITTPDHADYTLGSGDFTIDFWFNCNAAGGTYEVLFGQADATPTVASKSVFAWRRDTNVIVCFAVVGAVEYGVTGTTQFTNAVNTGWHHCAFVRTGNILKMFIDGVQEGGNVAIAGSVNNSPNAWGVGSLGEYVTDPWTGWIDAFRLSNVARWVANFTPPTMAYARNGNVAGPVSSVNQQLALFKGVGGDVIEPATLTGVLKATAGVPAVAVADTDYATPAFVAAAVGATGACRLTKSGANLLLSRFNGRTIDINGVLQTIPSAGVTLAPTALAINTTFYIYVFMNTGTMTLEASATAPVANTTTGVLQKTGDATRTLVGMARTITGPAWVDTAAQRFVLSWFNRRRMQAQNVFAATRSTTSTSIVELSSAERAEFLAWGDEDVAVGATAYANNSTVATSINTAVGVDGTALIDGLYLSIAQSTALYNMNASLPPVGLRLTEGYHYASLLGSVSANTGAWNGSATTGQRCAVNAALNG